jgi:hypothetical protein
MGVSTQMQGIVKFGVAVEQKTDAVCESKERGQAGIAS